MTNSSLTKDAAGKVTDRFSKMLKDLRDDLEEEIVVVTLMGYYNLAYTNDKTDTDLLWAIERVLQDFMTTHDFNQWLQNRDNGND